MCIYILEIFSNLCKCPPAQNTVGDASPTVLILRIFPSCIIWSNMFNPTFHFVENKSQLFAELKAKLTFRITVGLYKKDTTILHLFGFFRYDERGFIVTPIEPTISISLAE